VAAASQGSQYRHAHDNRVLATFWQVANMFCGISLRVGNTLWDLIENCQKVALPSGTF
jgi:hypothetical protein